MKSKLSLRELISFSLLAALMVIGKLLFEPLPNIHPLAALVMIYTLVYRRKALIPIYVYVFIQGIILGFSLWWVPYLYVWTVLWGITMLLPKNMPTSVALFVYPTLTALHGILFGVLYAPVYSVLFGLDFNGMIKWILAGIPFDISHAAGNFASGFLVLPITKVLRKIENRRPL